MKKIKCLDSEIAYQKSGKGKIPVILMHGWGVSRTLMEPLVDHFSHIFTVYYFDWPGFGESSTPPRIYTTITYCEVFAAFVKQLKIENPILIAHSFGCRIAMRYATSNPVRKMILTGAAGLKPKRVWSYYPKVYSFKVLKLIRRLPGLSGLGSRLKVGSSDYQVLTGVMKDTFVAVVNEDISGLLINIKCEVLLVYGEKDQDTPLWMGEYLASHLPNAGLAVFAGDDHYAYLHQLPRFLKVCDIFLELELTDA